VHILNWGAPLLALPPIAGKIIEAHSLLDGSPAEFTQNSNGIILKLPPAKNDETDRVVQLILAK
jgi:hypothetical protein